ncbi:MAG: thiol-disulfide oxidoreductase [Acidobacteria bacterium]|nr:MAG: thiol-disulfide oxidoreductase [Acidobacteriota bacterium]
MGAVVLFDGVCNFCDASVNFVIEHDPDCYFKFAPLQSEAGMKLAAEYKLDSKVANRESGDGSTPIDSVILIEDGEAYTHSTAALRIARRLTGLWSWSYAFIIVPASIRDFFYRVFAKYRYRFFGRKDECMLPTPEARARFL